LAEWLTIPDAGAWRRIVPGLAASLGFALAFFVAAALLRHPELSALRGALRRRRE